MPAAFLAELATLLDAVERPRLGAAGVHRRHRADLPPAAGRHQARGCRPTWLAQFVRPHRNDRRMHLLRGARRRAAARQNADRPAAGQQPRLPGRRRRRPPAARRGRRIVAGGRRRHPRLPRPAGAHRRKIRARSLRRGARVARLPQRRPGPLAALRRPRVPRPDRRPAQDPRLPHRAAARSKPCSPAIRRCAKPPCSASPAATASRSWSPT